MGYYKELYNTRRALHRCVQCGKQDAFTLNGRAYCADCTEWRRLYYLERARKKPEVLEKARAYGLSRTQRLREAGLCTHCGKRNVTPPYATCDRCRAKARAAYRAKREPYMNDETLCRKCHKRPRLEGKNMCAECTESFKRVQAIGVEKRRRRRNGETVCDG